MFQLHEESRIIEVLGIVLFQEILSDLVLKLKILLKLNKYKYIKSTKIYVQKLWTQLKI